MLYLTSQGPPSAHICWLRRNGDTERISTRKFPAPTTQSSGSRPGLAPVCTAWALELGLPHLAWPETPSWATGREQRWSHLCGWAWPPTPGRRRLQLTLRTGRPPHCAPPGLFGVGADGMVAPRRMEHPSRPLLRAPPETTELLPLGARPPRGPLAHFTLCWQEGRGEREEEGHQIPCSFPTCSLPGALPSGQESPERNPRGWSWGELSLGSAPATLSLARPPLGVLDPLPAVPTCVPGLLHSMVPLAAAEPSGQAG